MRKIHEEIEKQKTKLNIIKRMFKWSVTPHLAEQATAAIAQTMTNDILLFTSKRVEFSLVVVAQRYWDWANVSAAEATVVGLLMTSNE